MEIPDYGMINDRSAHLIADLLEIIAFHERRTLALGDIDTLVSQNGAPALIDEIRRDANGHHEETAVLNESIQRLGEDVFRHLFYRQKAFQEWYPFKVGKDLIEPINLVSRKHSIYLFLLVCSRLKMLPKKVHGRFANVFELITAHALAALLPGWEILQFGKGSADRKKLGSKLKVALAGLAAMLKESVVHDKVDRIGEKDTGDGGIDLVAFNRLNDDASGSSAYFVQCAAQQTGWPEKALEAHPVNQRKYISFQHDPGNCLAIPLCFRNPDGQWVSDEAHGAVLLDRLRMLRLMAHLPNKRIYEACKLVRPLLA